jgi:hypothetical protein
MINNIVKKNPVEPLYQARCSACHTHGTRRSPTVRRISGFDARSAGANAAPRHVHTRVVVRNLHRNEYLRRYVRKARTATVDCCGLVAGVPARGKIRC